MTVGAEPRASRRLDALATPTAVLALAVLLLNDFVLKARYPGVVTGKLSDFAGLYLFAFFWMVLFPGRRRMVAAWVTAAWILWKSPLADPLIGAWNGLGLLPVARVVDATDLAALVVIPLALWHPVLHRSRPRLAGPVLAALCMFAFAATSRMVPPIPLPGTEYRLPLDRQEVLERIYTLRLDYADPGVPPAGAGDPTVVVLALPPEDSSWLPSTGPDVEMEVADAPGGSTLRLIRARARGRSDPDSLRTRFERRVLERILRNEPNPFPAQPLTAGDEALYQPRLVAPFSLTEPRNRVTVWLQRPAHVALVEAGVDGEWRVIYPRAGETPPLLPAGESTILSDCPAATPRYEMRDSIPPCGVARPLRPREIPPPSFERARGVVYYPNFRPTPVSAGRMFVIASDAPIDRGLLAQSVAEVKPKLLGLWSFDVPRAFRRAARRSGGSHMAVSETILRR